MPQSSKKEGEVVARSLIGAMMNVGGGGSSGDEMGWVTRLAVHCPTFFGKSDLLKFKASESLARARVCFGVKNERMAFLKDALDFGKKAAANRKFALEEASREMRELHFYSGVVELCLFRAALIQNQDLIGTGAGAVTAGGAAAAAAGVSSQEFEFLKMEEKKAYDVILETLDILIFNRFRDPKEGTTPRLLHTCALRCDVQYADVLCCAVCLCVDRGASAEQCFEVGAGRSRAGHR
jgi:hypothetical protein